MQTFYFIHIVYYNKTTKRTSNNISYVIDECNHGGDTQFFHVALEADYGRIFPSQISIADEWENLISKQQNWTWTALKHSNFELKETFVKKISNFKYVKNYIF